MRIMYKAFAKKLFGIKFERVGNSLIISLIVFWSLHISGFQINISPSVLYLMTTAFTAGVMWQALSSDDNAANMMNMFMLPFEGNRLVLSYVGALGSYTLITKTILLLAGVSAVSSCSILRLMGCILCAINAITMPAAIYSMKKYRAAGFLWAGITAAGIVMISSFPAFLYLVAGNICIAAALLKRADAYSFLRQPGTDKRILKGTRGHSVWRYFFRYLAAHKNYLINTAAMWGIASVLPLFFSQMKSLDFMPVGFAILSLNTPICILLSCDPALEQAVRFLPGQKKAFCIPYCLFIFSCNMSANIIFILSWSIQIGGITTCVVLTSVLFALQSAAGSVLLEWFCPIRNWKIESDLWHHPRKYVVPAAMLLIAAAAGGISWFIYALAVVLAFECSILLFLCRRD